MLKSAGEPKILDEPCLATAEGTEGNVWRRGEGKTSRGPVRMKRGDARRGIVELSGRHDDAFNN